MDEDIIIETDRLILRKYKLSDVNDVVEGLNNLNVTKWLQGAPYPYTEQDALHFINKSISNNKDCINYTFEAKDNTLDENVVKQFCNDLIDQQLREITTEKFGHIRDLIVEEAFKPVNK